MKILFAIPLLFSTLAFGQAWSGVLSTSRATDWTQAGIPGGIPSSSWTQCGSTIAAYGTSGSPASPATINSALASCSGSSEYVLLGAGDFYLNAAIFPTTGTHHVELRGSGPTQTRLHFSAASTCQEGGCLVGFATSSGNYPGGPGTVANWTGGYTQGSNTITVDNGSAITAGTTMLILDQCDTGFSGAPCTGSAVDNGNFFSCEADLVWSGTPYSSSYTGCSYTGPVGAERPNRGQEEYVTATSCSPACGTAGTTTVTISPPLRHPNWSSGNTPQMWTIPAANYVGVRNLFIEMSNLTNYSATTAGIEFGGTQYYWVQNVVIDSPINIGIFMMQGVNHGDIESNYIYNVGQGTNDDSSGINILGANNLVTNNICQNALLCYVGNGPHEGSVISYNYFVNSHTANSTLYFSFDDGHANGIDYNLYEGNVGIDVAMDQAHGTHLVNSFYRNFFSGWESCANGNCGTSTEKTDNMFALQDISNHRYENFVANVLGTPGVSNAAGSVYEYNGGSPSDWYLGGPGDVGNIYNIGSGSTGSPPSYAGPIPYDPVVKQTLLRWGNWDAFNGSTQWNTAEVPTSPPSGVLANSVPTSTCTSSLSCPASFYLGTRPSWWAGSIPFPAIGPDVSSGNVGQCTGTLNTPGQYAGLATTAGHCTGTTLTSGWGGHINAIPAQQCALSLGIAPDGTGGLASGFDAATCYTGTSTCGNPHQNGPNYSGTYTVPPTVLPVSVSWSESTAGCNMFMTLDGSTPTCSSTAYAAQNFNSTTTMRVIACQGGYTPSSVVGGTWTIVATGTPTNWSVIVGAP